ncbi:hypothetical protein ABLV92_02395 [Staphylococcus equorum]
MTLMVVLLIITVFLPGIIKIMRITHLNQLKKKSGKMDNKIVYFTIRNWKYTILFYAIFIRK